MAPKTPPPPLVEGRDYDLDPDGRYVFTAAYLAARGTCCRSGCRHCPYGFGRPDPAAAAGAPGEPGGPPPCK
jgi:hypothetical protein